MSLLPLLGPLQRLYGSVVRARNTRFDRETPQRLRWPVVSVGNLSLGGSGKTPLVLCLARLLAREGWQVDILSRGYGRGSRETERVDPEGTALRFGDEPLLMARDTTAPVYVGASRYEAGLLAEKQIPQQGRHVHLLDDGFQHRRLARQVDLVLIHRSDLQERLLPAGRLREPLSSLARANAVVLREEDVELEPELRVYTGKDCWFWHVRRTLALPIHPRRALAFCAVARPSEFFLTLEAAGVGLAERIRFRDHHFFTPSEISRLAALGRRIGCDAFVVTAKDQVKLTPAMRERLEAVAPLRVAGLAVEIVNPDTALRQLSSLLEI